MREKLKKNAEGKIVSYSSKSFFVLMFPIFTSQQPLKEKVNKKYQQIFFIFIGTRWIEKISWSIEKIIQPKGEYQIS